MQIFTLCGYNLKITVTYKQVYEYSVSFQSPSESLPRGLPERPFLPKRSCSFRATSLRASLYYGRMRRLFSIVKSFMTATLRLRWYGMAGELTSCGDRLVAMGPFPQLSAAPYGKMPVPLRSSRALAASTTDSSTGIYRSSETVSLPQRGFSPFIFQLACVNLHLY